MRKLLATSFGIGLLPGPTGTYASAAAAVIALAAYHAGVPWWAAAAVTVLINAVGFIVARHAEKDFGDEDPGTFVLDEVAGQLIATMALWLPWNPVPWAVAGVAFVWFRITDIIKPPPARQLEDIHGGWGIMLDDVAAGLMSLGLTAACQYAFVTYVTV